MRVRVSAPGCVIAACVIINNRVSSLAEFPRIDRIILSLPAYNEAEVIGELLAQAEQTLGASGLPYNILVTDDGSKDATGEIVRRAAENNPAIQLLVHEKNKGLGPAILTGLKRAVEISPSNSTLIVCMDADLTHPPAVIPSMIDAANVGADVVIASRFQPESKQVGLSAFRHLLSFGARIVFRTALALPGVRDYTCGFRGMRAGLIQQAMSHFGPEGLITRRGFACTDELLVKLALLGPVIREVPFTLRYDLKRGKSKINLSVTLAETLRLVGWARRELKADRRKRAQATQGTETT